MLSVISAAICESRAALFLEWCAAVQSTVEALAFREVSIAASRDLDTYEMTLAVRTEPNGSAVSVMLVALTRIPCI